MKKLTLFNMELTCDIDKFSGYFAAENAAGAEELARKAIHADYLVWWEEEGSIREAAEWLDTETQATDTDVKEMLEKTYQEMLDELNKMRVTMLIEVGAIIV